MPKIMTDAQHKDVQRRFYGDNPLEKLKAEAEAKRENSPTKPLARQHVEERQALRATHADQLQRLLHEARVERDSHANRPSVPHDLETKIVARRDRLRVVHKTELDALEAKHAAAMAAAKRRAELTR